MGDITGLVAPPGGGVSLAQAIAASVPYTGPVATNGKVHDQNTATNGFFMSRTLHVATDNIVSLRLVFSNFSMINTGDVLGGTTATYTAAIEYPAGTFTQVKFIGSSSGTAVSGANLVSDPVNVLIPIGASFFVRNYRVHTAGSFAAGYTKFGETLANAGGDTCAFGTTSAVTDQTMGGTVTNSSASITAPPTAIIGLTSRATYFLVGDSRICTGGTSEATTSACPSVGELSPAAWAQQVGYIQCATQADTAQNWGTHHGTLCAPLGLYCSNIICNLSINDLTASQTAAQLITSIQAIMTLFPGKKFWVCTIAPKTASSDSWATIANQTIDATSNTNRVSYNTTLRTGIFAGASGYIDIAAVVESSLNSGKWIVTGAANYATADGLHEVPAATALIVASGNVNYALITKY